MGNEKGIDGGGEECENESVKATCHLFFEAAVSGNERESGTAF